jgi:glycosyltransferase involved in cell wall biosynthesis
LHHHPCIQRAHIFAQVISTLPAWLDHIIIVDDCSEDEIAAIVQSLENPKINFYSTPANLGVGGTMKLRFFEALKTDSNIFIKMDSNGQMDPDCLEELLAPILERKANYTKGNRFMHTRELKNKCPLSADWVILDCLFFQN